MTRFPLVSSRRAAGHPRCCFSRALRTGGAGRQASAGALSVTATIRRLPVLGHAASTRLTRPRRLCMWTCVETDRPGPGWGIALPVHGCLEASGAGGVVVERCLFCLVVPVIRRHRTL